MQGAFLNSPDSALEAARAPRASSCFGSFQKPQAKAPQGPLSQHPRGL